MIAAPQYSTRLVRQHEPWIPLPYMKRAVRHLLESNIAALWLDPGLGKTAIVLETFRQLKRMGVADKMLVIAPLRVCQLVWEQEGRKWTQFRELSFSLIHGTIMQKQEALREDVDIHLINPEGIAWLAQQYFGRSDIPWDTVVIDELTKFKNSRAGRSRKLRKKLGRVSRRWGLTGTPSPNGYMDLFGQFLLLDDGAAFGKYITYFRDMYFRQGFNGFDYELKPGAAERIEERIAPYVLRMSAEEYLTLPPLKNNEILIDLPKKARAQYEEMKKETLLSLPEGVITAANAGAVYSKLKQMANGAVYIRENEYVELHDAKLDALEDLVEELAGQPLLVAYEFQHDLARLKERFGQDVPSLAGLSHKRIIEMEAAWNNGELPLMFAHPASTGHGLNLQGSGAGHICWYSRPWDLELYDQFIRRLLRQGNTAKRIMNHILIVKDSMDEIVGEALEGKNTTQQKLLNALNAVLQDDPALTHNGEDEDMAVKKLGFRGAENGGGSAAPAAAAGSSARVQPRGWGAPAAEPDNQQEEEQQEEQEQAQAPARPARPQRPAAPAASDKPTPRGWGAPAGAEPEGDDQRGAIAGKIEGQQQSDLPFDEQEEEEEVPSSVKALQAFPAGVTQQLTGGDSSSEEQKNEPEPKPETPKKRTRRAATQVQDKKDIPEQASTGASARGDAMAANMAAHNAQVHAATGVNPETLAALFDTMAALLRGE